MGEIDAPNASSTRGASGTTHKLLSEKKLFSGQDRERKSKKKAFCANHDEWDTNRASRFASKTSEESRSGFKAVALVGNKYRKLVGGERRRNRDTKEESYEKGKESS